MISVSGGSSGSSGSSTDNGTDIEACTPMPSGGAGVRGWLSAIWTKLNGTLTTSVSNFPATQPVSGTVTVGNSSIPVTDNGGSLTVDGTVNVGNLPATQAVSGTFWQATQPVSLATNIPDVTDRAARLLGHVTVDNSAIPVTDNGSTLSVDDGAGSLTVDGTVAVSNLPATQPVSGTVTANAGTGTMAVSGPLTDTQLRASAVPVSGPVTDTQLRATALPVSGTVTVANLPSATHTPVTLYATALTGITTEALATLQINKGGATSSGTAYTVTAGKTLRIMSFTLSVIVPSTVGCASRAFLRSAGTVSASSPVSAVAAAGTGNTAFAGGVCPVTLPEATAEFAAGQQVGISHIESSTIAGSATTGAGVTICAIGYEY